jgi:hypothetical protein
MDPDLFSDLSIIYAEAKRISMFDFLNKIMSKVYMLIHNVDFPGVFEEMKIKLQFDSDYRVGDCFLYKDSTIIRFYGF